MPQAYTRARPTSGSAVPPSVAAAGRPADAVASTGTCFMGGPPVPLAGQRTFAASGCPRRSRGTAMVEVLQIETPTRADRTYLAHDARVAVVIDPQRDIDRVTALAGRLGVRITHVAETHIH